MDTLKVSLRAVVYETGQRWVAHCLEFDVTGEGDTHWDALRSLETAITNRVKHALANQELENLFSPAAGKFFQMFAVGKYLPFIRIHPKAPPDSGIEFGKVELREYVDGVVIRG